MVDEERNDLAVFVRMAREFPVRTGIFTFGLPLFACLQMLNGVVHKGSLLAIGFFSVLVVVCSVQLTQYHIAVYRRQRLSWNRNE